MKLKVFKFGPSGRYLKLVPPRTDSRISDNYRIEMHAQNLLADFLNMLVKLELGS